MRPRTKPRNSHADHAKWVSRMTFSPNAAVVLGLKPHSAIRPVIASSTMTSMIKALTTSASCNRSKRPGGGRRVTSGDGIQQQAQHDDEQQVEEDERIALDVDAVVGPDDGDQEDQQGGRE